MALGHPVKMVVVVTGCERPRRLVSTTYTASMEIAGALTFDAVPEGTRMHWSWDLEPQGLRKVMGRLVAVVGRRQERTIWAGLSASWKKGDPPPRSAGRAPLRPQAGWAPTLWFRASTSLHTGLYTVTRDSTMAWRMLALAPGTGR